MNLSNGRGESHLEDICLFLLAIIICCLLLYQVWQVAAQRMSMNGVFIGKTYTETSHGVSAQKTQDAEEEDPNTPSEIAGVSPPIQKWQTNFPCSPAETKWLCNFKGPFVL